MQRPCGLKEQGMLEELEQGCRTGKREGLQVKLEAWQGPNSAGLGGSCSGGELDSRDCRGSAFIGMASRLEEVPLEPHVERPS